MRVNQLNYNIDWTKFKVGWSFFLPCLRTGEGKQEVLKVTNRFGFDVTIKVVIENNAYVGCVSGELGSTMGHVIFWFMVTLLLLPASCGGFFQSLPYLIISKASGIALLSN
jgi:hypothetical protein